MKVSDLTRLKSQINYAVAVCSLWQKDAEALHMLINTEIERQATDGWILTSECPPTKEDGVGKLDEVLIYMDGKPLPIPWHCITYCPEAYPHWTRLPKSPSECE